jgi:hypothetical protein
MPELSRFLGIAVAMFYAPEDAPHFDAFAGPYRIRVDIETGLVAGSFPPRALGLVLEWRQRYVAELRHNWMLARSRQPLVAIPPLE